MVAIGVRETGEKSVLGVAVGASESRPGWREVCRSLVARGLHSLKLVPSDAPAGRKGASAPGAAGHQLAALAPPLPSFR